MTNFDSGNFGAVSKAVWKGKNCAVKQITFFENEVTTDDLAKEVKKMRSIKPHANVLKLFGVCSKPESPFYIVMEYLVGKVLLVSCFLKH